MNFIQLLRLSFEALKERRLRTGLTILMVIMGASLLVALNGTGNGFTNFVNNQFSSLGANVLILTPRSESIKIDSVLADEISRISGVGDTILYIQQIAAISSQGSEQTTIVVGVEQSKLPLLFPTISFETGTFVSETDNVGAILGNEVARQQGQSQSFANLGETVKIIYQGYENQRPTTFQKSFVIRGLINYMGSGIVPADQMTFISTSAARKLFNRGDNYDGMYVVSQNSDANEQVLNSLRDKYGNDLVIISPQQISNVIQQISSGVYLFINVVAMVSLLVASVGIITTLQTSVMERIKEIGLLKALGFNRQLILGLFLFEAMIIGMVGGAIGVTLGIGLSQGMSALLGQNFNFESTGPGTGFRLQLVPSYDLSYMFMTWCLCVFLSMVSGLYPSWRASRLDPVVALRTE